MHEQMIYFFGSNFRAQAKYMHPLTNNQTGRLSVDPPLSTNDCPSNITLRTQTTLPNLWRLGLQARGRVDGRSRAESRWEPTLMEVRSQKPLMGHPRRVQEVNMNRLINWSFSYLLQVLFWGWGWRIRKVSNVSWWNMDLIQVSCSSFVKANYISSTQIKIFLVLFLGLYLQKERMTGWWLINSYMYNQYFIFCKYATWIRLHKLIE